MNKLFAISSFQMIAATVLVLAAPLSMARDYQPEVSWSLSVGSGHPAQQVYGPPPVVYVQPQPVYVRPRPVYVQPATIVQYGQPYYVEEVRHKKHHHWKHRDNRRHHDWHDH